MFMRIMWAIEFKNISDQVADWLADENEIEKNLSTRVRSKRKKEFLKNWNEGSNVRKIPAYQISVQKQIFTRSVEMKKQQFAGLGCNYHIAADHDVQEVEVGEWYGASAGRY